MVVNIYKYSDYSLINIIEKWNLTARNFQGNSRKRTDDKK